MIPRITQVITLGKEEGFTSIFKLLDSETRSAPDINVYFHLLLEEGACLAQVRRDANTSLSTFLSVYKPNFLNQLNEAHVHCFSYR